MCTPVRSCRHTTGRMPAMAAASMRGLDGMTAIQSTPSIFSTLATAVTPSTVWFLLSFSSVIPAKAGIQSALCNKMPSANIGEESVHRRVEFAGLFDHWEVARVLHLDELGAGNGAVNFLFVIAGGQRIVHALDQQQRSL